MQVHHRFDEKRLALEAVNNGVWESMKVELAIVRPKEAATIGIVNDLMQRGLKLGEKLLA